MPSIGGGWGGLPRQLFWLKMLYTRDILVDFSWCSRGIKLHPPADCMGEWAPPSFFTQLSCKGVVSQDFDCIKSENKYTQKGWASEDI